MRDELGSFVRSMGVILRAITEAGGLDAVHPLDLAESQSRFAVASASAAVTCQCTLTDAFIIIRPERE
jgi:hypothetical protein